MIFWFDTFPTLLLLGYLFMQTKKSGLKWKKRWCVWRKSEQYGQYCLYYYKTQQSSEASVNISSSSVECLTITKGVLFAGSTWRISGQQGEGSHGSEERRPQGRRNAKGHLCQLWRIHWKRTRGNYSAHGEPEGVPNFQEVYQSVLAQEGGRVGGWYRRYPGTLDCCFSSISQCCLGGSSLPTTNRDRFCTCWHPVPCNPSFPLILMYFFKRPMGLCWGSNTVNSLPRQSTLSRLWRTLASLRTVWLPLECINYSSHYANGILMPSLDGSIHS